MRDRTKFVVCVPDGCADRPHPALGRRTPLQAARMPTLAALTAGAELGRAAVIPPGMPPGSDVGNLSLLGYDPAQFHTGRAPIEAAALGLRLEPDEIAFRCNLVRLDGDTMADFAGGHPSNEVAATAIAALNEALADDQVRFHPGVQYRHIMVAPADWLNAQCVPPHDLTGDLAVWPSGPGAEHLQRLMDASTAILDGIDGVDANHIWLWGQGRMPVLQSFRDRFGLDAGLVTAVDLVRGLGALADVAVYEVEGATGWYDTNYEGKRDAAIGALSGDTDLFVIHIEATDEAGHAGNVEAKVEALENWDSRVLAGLCEAMDELGEWRLLMAPDHATPLDIRTHTADPVPYLIADGRRRGGTSDGGSYDEVSTAALPVVAGHELIGRLVGGRR